MSTLIIKNNDYHTMNIIIDGIPEDEARHYREIFIALISSGGLTGVKSGQTILHFGPSGEFMGIQLSYWPWKKRVLSTQ
jgi:hypothetical protein